MFACTLHSVRLLPRSRWPLACVYVRARWCARGAWCCLVSLRRAMTTQRAAFARPACSVWWLSTLWLARISNPTWHSSRAARYRLCQAFAFSHTCFFHRRRALSSSHVVISEQVAAGWSIKKDRVIFALHSWHVSLGYYISVEVWRSCSPEWRDPPLLTPVLHLWSHLIECVSM